MKLMKGKGRRSPPIHISDYATENFHISYSCKEWLGKFWLLSAFSFSV